MNVYFAHPYKQAPTRGTLAVVWSLAHRLWNVPVVVHPGKGVFQRHPVCRSWDAALPFLLGEQPDGRPRFDAFISATVDLGRFNAWLLDQAMAKQRPVLCLRANALWTAREVLTVDSADNPGTFGRLALARVPAVS